MNKEIDYINYKIRVFARIPKGNALIVESIFNGNNIGVKKGGFAIMAPWKKSKFIKVASKNYDYPAQVFEDKDGQDLTVDVAIDVEIIDPIKYQYSSQNVDIELKQLIESIIRVLVKNSACEDLQRVGFEISETKTYKNSGDHYYFGKYGSDDKFHAKREAFGFEKELAKARIALDEFAERRGLLVTKLSTKSIQQSKEIQEIYNKRIIAEKEREAALIEEQGKLERAELEAQKLEINARAEANAEKMKLNARYEAFKEAIASFPKDQQAKMLHAFMIANGKNTNVFYGMDEGSSMKTGTIGGAAAGTVINGKGQKK